MYRPGHYGMALLLYSIVGYILLSKRHDSHALTGTVLVVLVTMTPDWDTHVSWLPHRGPTHSFGFALLVGAACGLLVVVAGRYLGQRTLVSARLGVWAAGLGTLSVVAHVLADAINPVGVRPFYPISNRHVTLDIIPASDFVGNVGLLAAGLLATAACWRVASDRRMDELPTLSVLLRRIHRYLQDPIPE